MMVSCVMIMTREEAEQQQAEFAVQSFMTYQVLASLMISLEWHTRQQSSSSQDFVVLKYVLA